MIINVGTVAPFGGGKAVIEGCTGGRRGSSSGSLYMLHHSIKTVK